MARKFLTPIDMTGLQIYNLCLQNLGTDAPSPGVGLIYFNTAVTRPKWSDGTNIYDVYPSATGNTANTNVLRDSSGNFIANVGTFSGVTVTATPSASTDVATVGYVQQYLNGMAPKGEVRFTTAAALPANTYNNGTAGVGATLTANANGALTVDGGSPSAGDLIGVINEANPVNNGIYSVTQAGSVSTPYILTRATNFNSAADIKGGYFISGTEGATLGGIGYIVVGNGPWTIGTTSIQFTTFSTPSTITVSAPLSKSGNNISLTLASRIVNNSGSLDLQSGVPSGGAGTFYGSVTVDTYGRVTAGAATTAAGGRSALSASGLYETTITGDGTTTTFAVTHGLGNQQPNVVVRDSSYNKVEVDDNGYSTNVVHLSFAVAPTSGATFYVTVEG